MTKRRKMTEAGTFIRVGPAGKMFNIDGYLNGPKSKDVKTEDTKSKHVSAAPAIDDTIQAAEQPAKADTTKPHGTTKKGPSSVQKTQAERGDKNLLRVREKLPIWKHRDEFREALRKEDMLVVVAETGSGKSTQIPQFLATEDWCRKKTVSVRTAEGRTADVSVGGMIAVTQPRRVAATTLARRVAQEAGTPLAAPGCRREGLVGYSVRFDHNVPKGTKIKFLTEGMLLQELIHDPHLRQYSAVLVDEIHERSIDVDLLAGFLKQILSGDKAGRGGIPLKVGIMSATANVEKIQSFFTLQNGTKTQTPTYFKIPGRLYPVDIIHTSQPVPDIQDALLKRIFQIHAEQPCPGDILAFLTGQEEIETAQKIIEDHARGLPADMPRLVPVSLFGQMSIEAQQKAFQPASGRIARKVVLATNIAETSVTVPGVRYVIDTGKAKVRQYRVRLGMDSLLPKPISKSSAVQRAGRAGREAAGKCYRLYTEETYETMLPDADVPEILRIDILGAVLTMKARGIDDIFSFPLMDTPDDESFDKALLHLHMLDAIADDGSLTEMGRKMAHFPLTAPYGRVLLAAADPRADCLLEAIDIIACLTSGEDIFYHLRSEEEIEETQEHRQELYRREGDLLTYLTAMQLYTSEQTDRKAWCQKRGVNSRIMKAALNVRRQLRALCVREKLLVAAPPPDPQPFVPLQPGPAETLLKCFVTGFAVKTAILAPDASYVTSVGKHVVAIHPASVLHGKKKEAIMFLEHVFTTKNYAKKVSVVQGDWIVQAMEGGSYGTGHPHE